MRECRTDKKTADERAVKLERIAKYQGQDYKYEVEEVEINPPINDTATNEELKDFEDENDEYIIAQEKENE